MLEVVVHNAPEKNAKRANNSHEFALTKELVPTRTFRGTKNNRVVQKLHQDTFVSKYAFVARRKILSKIRQDFSFIESNAEKADSQRNKYKA